MDYFQRTAVDEQMEGRRRGYENSLQIEPGYSACACRWKARKNTCRETCNGVKVELNAGPELDDTRGQCAHMPVSQRARILHRGALRNAAHCRAIPGARGKLECFASAKPGCRLSERLTGIAPYIEHEEQSYSLRATADQEPLGDCCFCVVDHVPNHELAQ